VTRLEKDLDRVYDALDDGAIEKAARLAERLFAGNPDDPEAILALAYARRASGRFEEAAAGARRAASLLTDDPDPWVLEASSLLELDRFEEALDVVRSAPAAVGDDPFLVALEVEILALLRRKRELAPAIARLEQATVADSDAGAWLDRLDSLADALSHAGFRREADRVNAIADAIDDAVCDEFGDDFEEDEPEGRPLLRTDAAIIVAAIRRNPDLLRKFLDGRPVAFEGLGAREGPEDPAAITFVDTALRWVEGGAPLVNAPAGAPREIAKAVEAVNAGDAVTARQLARQVADADPDNVTALAVLGHAAALRGNYVKAVEWFSRAVALAPEDPRLHAHLSCAAALAGNTAMALKALEDSLNASAEAAKPDA
jgi:Flp pilus assembly protein TadD